MEKNEPQAICSSCRRVRDAAGQWISAEEDLLERIDIELTHGVCPDCMQELYPEDEEVESSASVKTSS